ncbi:glycerophosphodiester phosphodiesterase family protein [Terrisporobacter sp.]
MKIFAHRGLSGFYPENTILAFKKCLNLNIYGIELDVQKSKDNHLVVIHDEKVDRTFIGSGYIKDMTLEELKSLKSSFKDFEDNEDCKIPTLEEVLKLFKPTEFIINIELKNSKTKYKDLEKDVIKLVKKLKMGKKVIISSFRMDSLKKVRKYSSKVKIAYLVSDKFYKLRPKFLIFLDLINYNFSYVNPNHKLVDKNFIKKYHSKNLQVLCYTVNTIEDYERLSKIKADGIFTDFANIFPLTCD